jgi:hypothetical protein
MNMTWERFCGLVETWGGEIELWPGHERIAARQFAETAEAAELLTRARAFDRLLAIAPQVSVERAAIASFAVTQRIAAENGRKSHRFPPLKWFFPAASLACSVAVGVSLALAVPYERSHEQQVLLSVILDSTSLPMVW